jgi:hypothetical protein
MVDASGQIEFGSAGSGKTITTNKQTVLPSGTVGLADWLTTHKTAILL